MARLSKKASKILFEIICEDSFEGQTVKSSLPATRKISKSKEALWEYIRSELTRRSEESYDLGTICAAWYYNIRKIGSSLDQIDTAADGKVAIGRLRTLERYVCDNLGDRIRGKGRGRKEDDGDAKLTPHQILTLSRQSTMDATVHYSPQVAGLSNEVVMTTPQGVAIERESSSIEIQPKEEPNEMNNRDYGMDDNEMIDIGGTGNDLNDPIETPRMGANHSNLSLDDHEEDEVELRLNEQNPRPSRYNTAETTPMSRNNSTISVSGYDADNEKGLIKRRRKEFKKRLEKEKEVIKEEEEEVEVDNGNDEEEKVDEEVDNEMEEDQVEDEERYEEDNDEENKNKKMMDNLKGMIENLRDHCVSLRIMGVVDASDMESLADSFENAGKSIMNNVDTQ